MKVKFKGKLFLALALIALCVIPLFCSSCVLLAYQMLKDADEAEKRISTSHSSVVFDFNNIWEMEFPEEFSAVFVYYHRGGWMGEGSFSAIYECEQPNEEFLENFSQDLNDEVKEIMPDFEFYCDNSEYFEENYGVEISLDRAYLPDFGKEFISVAYHQGSDEHLYMCYFPESKLLYIHEDIT